MYLRDHEFYCFYILVGDYQQLIFVIRLNKHAKEFYFTLRNMFILVSCRSSTRLHQVFFIYVKYCNVPLLVGIYKKTDEDDCYEDVLIVVSKPRFHLNFKFPVSNDFTLHVWQSLLLSTPPSYVSNLLFGLMELSIASGHCSFSPLLNRVVVCNFS